jgi:hypothetical protein
MVAGEDVTGLPSSLWAAESVGVNVRPRRLHSRLLLGELMADDLDQGCAGFAVGGRHDPAADDAITAGR